METLDQTDLELLRILQKDSKLTVKAIAALVNLSPSPVFERIKRLEQQGYIKNYKIIEDGKQGVIKVTLKYTDGKTPVITGLRRVSKPGLRIYSNAEDMPKVMKGLGIAIISTSKGVMTDREARKQHIGGEVLAYIW